ncbi:hypothetical protein GCK72_016671 [Caenorhabditis remanei]|uniref:GPI inositol-deacylase n=1 Tax=Caenorhabditis remanei TaxID=31234 RepID=A0A6A5G627_CAERE|nr:hypothetical protein GCK72_016671 [Caenorhabditis remanei]KAF1750125.1 hypothetical protein GCK72_016671 [Caenorhabditis remanei]
MKTGTAAEDRRNRETCAVFEVITLTIILTIATFGVLAGGYLHTIAHSYNSCSMTYMYRKLQFLNISFSYPPSSKYSLVVYNEGYRWWNRSTIDSNQIPVLFIPGSKGSSKQVRSLASVMQNKTEMRHSQFGFRFFAVDFDEEMTFMSGNIVNRQLDYVMHSIRRIQALMRVKRKIVLVGHSYGGMIALLTTIHPEFQNQIELVIVKGAPLNKTPVMNDWLTMKLNRFLTTQWNSLQSSSSLSHVGVVAYTGGLRDYLIPDEWSILKNVTHRPLWTVDNVSDLGSDHLAILWCNEFVRHVSRVLYSYGEQLNEKTGREVVQNYYKTEIDGHIKRAKLVSHVSEIPTKEIKLGEKYEGIVLKSKQVVLLVKPQRFEVIGVRINGTCVNSMVTVRHHESQFHFENATADGIVETWIYRAAKNEKVRLLLDVTLPCSIDIYMTHPYIVQFWRFYEIMFSYLNEVIATFIVTCCFFAVLLREPGLKAAGLLLIVNLISILAVLHGCVDPDNIYALPMAIGYFLALGWRAICFGIDAALISKMGFIQRGHRALRADMLINGLYLIGVAITLVASNEGTMFLITVLAYRHHRRAVLLALPSLLPLGLKVVGARLFSIDPLPVYELQYQPQFYAALLYLWGLFSSVNVGQITMRSIIYGLTPAFMYLLNSPLELFSGFALLIFSAARFVPYGTKRGPVAPPAPAESSQRQEKNNYNLRRRR